MMLTDFFLASILLGQAFSSPVHHFRYNYAMAKRASHLHKREVPQEHSHDFVLTITREFLALDNPKNIQDPVFGLLGNAAAAAGAGDVTDLDCLKQETADQAFTNAKSAGDLRGMAGALLFQAIERNTGGVGVASNLCTGTAVNAEIGALTQHQDPASDNAGALNKAVTLELAKQLAAIGADPELALLSGTFAAGDTTDNTGAGNSCDDEEPALGCIFSQNLLVLDASQDEISSAVAGVAQTFTGTGGIFASDLVDLTSFNVASVTGSVDLSTIVNGGGSAGGASSALITATPVATPVDSAADTTPTVGAGVGASTAAVSATLTSAASQQTGSSGTSGQNIQAFTGDLGGTPPAVISSTGNRPFEVNGNTFTGSGAALARSCDIQHNACANAANSGQLSGGVSQCETQVSECKAANNI